MRLIEVAKLINDRFDDYDFSTIWRARSEDVGCMNACGHHTWHIGILGVDKGARMVSNHHRRRAGADASLGQVIGPSGPRPRCRRHMRLLSVYVETRRRRTLPRHRAPPRREAI